MPTTSGSVPRPLVVGNWKMNGTSASLAEIDAVARSCEDDDARGAELVICPPATLIHRAASRAGSALQIGGQDCAPKPPGAHTGDVAAEQLRDAGARYVILGHSERRRDHGETDAVVRSKVEAAIGAGLMPIICVGETRAERDAGDAFGVVERQLDGSLPRDLEGLATVVLAYEPVWAIGSGLTPTPEEVGSMHRFIRGRLLTLSPRLGARVPILYGGSVKPENAADLLMLDQVGGALIGGASLQARRFTAIAGIYRRAPPANSARGGAPLPTEVAQFTPA